MSLANHLVEDDFLSKLTGPNGDLGLIECAIKVNGKIIKSILMYETLYRLHLQGLGSADGLKLADLPSNEFIG